MGVSIRVSRMRLHRGVRQMTNLILHVRKIYFDQIKSGEKTEEYRIPSPYWCNRFSEDKPPFEKVLIACGYPSKTDTDKWISFPFSGIQEKLVTSPEFGKKPVWVFAIALKRDLCLPSPGPVLNPSTRDFVQIGDIQNKCRDNPATLQ